MPDIQELTDRAAAALTELAEAIAEEPVGSDRIRSVISHLLQGQAQISRGLAELFRTLAEEEFKG